MTCRDCIYLSVTFDKDDKERFFCTCDDHEILPSQEACDGIEEEEPQKRGSVNDYIVADDYDGRIRTTACRG